jgi:cytoskeleton protein RodZ
MTLEELGAVLRNEREKRAMSVDDVSEILKIGARLLRALEEGDTASLPHPTYARGFIRSYASFLGLAAEEVDSAVIPLPRDDATTARPNVFLAEASKKTPGKSRAPVIILLLVIAGALGVAWPLYTKLNTTSQRLAQPSPPAETRQGQPQPPPQKMSRTADGAQESSRTPVQESGPTPPEPQAAETPVAASLPPPSGPAAQNPPLAPETPQAKPPTHNVIVTAVEECWIHSQADGTDTRQFSLQKGDTFALTFREKLDVKLGNAGGVRIRYDGRDMPVPGQSGQVRTLRFPPPAQQE